MAEEDRTFSPNQVEADRTRMQDNGVGQRELDLQRDPTKARSAEQYSFEDEEGREDVAPPRDPNRPQGADQYDFDGDDNPQEDGGQPMGHAQTGRDHTRRPERTEAMRGQGPKTRKANKKIAENRPGYGQTS